MQIGELSNRTLKKLYIKKKNPIAQNLSFVPNNTLVSVRRGAQERCWIKVTFHAAERVRQKIHLANEQKNLWCEARVVAEAGFSYWMKAKN